MHFYDQFTRGDGGTSWHLGAPMGPSDWSIRWVALGMFKCERLSVRRSLGLILWWSSSRCSVKTRTEEYQMQNLFCFPVFVRVSICHKFCIVQSLIFQQQLDSSILSSLVPFYAILEAQTSMLLHWTKYVETTWSQMLHECSLHSHACPVRSTANTALSIEMASIWENSSSQCHHIQCAGLKHHAF